MGAIISTTVTIFLTLLSTRPSDIKYGCKWIASYLYAEYYKRAKKPRFDLYDMESKHDPYKVSFLPPAEEIVLESPLPESQLLHAADEVFFYGVNSKSEYLMTRIARSSNEEAQAWIYLKLSNGKIYQLHETSGYQQSCRDKRSFTCGGLLIHYLSPMRRWRIFFNGLLRETSDEDVTSNKNVHVKFAVMWRASSDVFDFTSDVSIEALATGLAKAKWNQYLPPLDKLYNAFNFYAQNGIIMGTVNVGNEDEQNIYLFGERVRFIDFCDLIIFLVLKESGESVIQMLFIQAEFSDYSNIKYMDTIYQMNGETLFTGDSSSGKGTELFHVFGNIFRNGRFFHIAEASITNVVENLTFGFSTSLIGQVDSITDAKSIIRNLTDKEKDENDIEATFHTHDKSFTLKGTLAGNQKSLRSNKGWDGRLTIDCINFELNSLKGKGIVIRGKRMKPSKRAIPKSQLHPTPSVVPLVVHFSEKICQNPDVTGGKGSSLGKLTELSREFQNFVVPNGIVVTTGAYELFITNEILNEIKKLEDVLYRDKIDAAKEACQRIMDEVTKSPIPDPLLQAVATSLQKAFPDRKHDHKFAIRSSATGEDTEQMSAAGQMDTFLGVAGISEIMMAIKKCWASQFGYIAVQYKRQNGQIINSPMAVVVQQMISCDVAGVLFTCDPLTGNPTTMTITANYGLGESVVSGSEEPDTIEIERLNEENLIIKNKTIGSKSRRIILKDDGEINSEDVSENERESCCITDSMALRLGHLAAKIEKSYRSYRDIEWGFWNNNLYLFQSRPVTSGTGETDFEIEHELDGPLRSEGEYFTKANVGEVMPGTTSPLGLEVTMKFFRIVFQKIRFVDWDQSNRSYYYPRGLLSIYNHVFFYAIDLFPYVYENPSSAQISAVGLFGRIVEDDEMFEMARERFGDKKSTNESGFKENVKRFYRALFGAGRKLKQDQKAYEGYHIPTAKCKNSHDMFDRLLYSCTDLAPAFHSHMACSKSSSMLNMFIFTILQKARGEINADVYRDFAHLLTTCSEMESSDVPSAIESLSYYISQEIKPEDFKSMNADDTLRWLQTSSTKSGIKFREFLEKYGHRCLKEFDIRSYTWGEDPKSLIQFLKNTVGSVKSDRTHRKQEDSQKLFSDLRTPLSFKNKLLLKFLLPLSRRAVEWREGSKSLVIRTLNEWRKGYRKLAKMMVLEGRIPDEDLLFFMTFEEIKELLSSRSPKIIAKANHRRRRQPILDKYVFPEILKGFPNPINMERQIAVMNDDNFSMKGIPVSQGIAKGTVRVALDLEEAALLQPGEILVTYSTDIGWSPYFPILGGVVTEIGGLISHGAVVSREYGLPCIAGLHGATVQFQTGDYVLLDGNKGILQRLPKTEDS